MLLAFVLVQEGKITRANFPMGGIIFFEMRLYLCKREIYHALAFPFSGIILFEMYLCLLKTKS